MAFKKVSGTEDGTTKSAAPGADATTKAILYIEDEDLNWEIAENELSRKYKMTRAATDKEAFRIVMREKFDVILMDVQLSGSTLNGIDITKILKGKYEKEPPSYARVRTTLETPIVVVTAYASTYTRDVVTQVGADDIIYKPVNFSNLSLLISRMLMRSVRKGA
jgi:CheY-like chemotaxis protein